MVNFTFKVISKEGRARSGVISTAHGKLLTPCFTPVGTRASVRGLSPDDLILTNSQAVLANTYHLYLSPGPEVIREFGGLGKFMNFKGPTVTDSGGYQVSFLWSKNPRMVKINDEGAIFRSHIDGTLHKITPEKSMQIQADLGADIIMSFDEPVPFGASPIKIKKLIQRSKNWEERSFVEWKRIQKKSPNFQALYGVVQGEAAGERIEFLEFIRKLDFPGIAMGGETIGSNIEKTKKALSEIPYEYIVDKPVHALGLGGGVRGIFEAVEEGIDTFDNTSVTRLAREGFLFVGPESGGNAANRWRINIKKADQKLDTSPISKSCSCYSCTSGFTRGYLRHLLTNSEILGLRLATIHNIHFINSLMANIRDSINEGKLGKLKKSWIGVN